MLFYLFLSFTFTFILSFVYHLCFKYFIVIIILKILSLILVSLLFFEISLLIFYCYYLFEILSSNNIIHTQKSWLPLPFIFKKSSTNTLLPYLKFTIVILFILKILDLTL